MKTKTQAVKPTRKGIRNLAPKDPRKTKAGYMTYTLKNAMVTSYSFHD